MIRFACACGKTFRAQPELAGKRFRCHVCEAESTIPVPPPGPPCPYCSRPVVPPPARSKKCPSCKRRMVLRRGRLLTEARAAELDAEKARREAEYKARRRDEMIRLARETNAAKIKSADGGRVAIGFELEHGPERCRHCEGLKGKFIPIETCAPESLPPYEPCELEAGCPTTFEAVPSPEWKRHVSRMTRS